MTTTRLTYPHRRRGLDHDWFPHDPTHRRTPVLWPDGKRIALWITVPVEFFPLDAPPQPFRPLGGLPLGYPDLWNFSNRDYGLRIGVFRMSPGARRIESARDGGRQFARRLAVSSPGR